MILGENFGQGNRELSAKQFLYRFTESFSFGPAIEPFRSLIPVRDSMIGVANKNRVVCQFQHLILLRHLRCTLSERSRALLHNPLKFFPGGKQKKLVLFALSYE